jgi:DNA-binding XRE family transcriptional regulator
LEELKSAFIQKGQPVPDHIIDDLDVCVEFIRQCRDAESGNFWTLIGLYGLGELMVIKRYATGVTQRAVAKHVGIAQSNYCDLENGEFENMKLKDVIKVCEAIGLKLKIDVVED